MRSRRLLSRLALVASALIMLSGCESPEQQMALGGTRAWIDVPRDHSVLSLKPHEVMAHASDAAGLRQVELVVNGASIGAMTCEDFAQPLVTCRAMWNPLAPGDYRLEARATNPSGSVGTSTPVYVSIGEGSPPAVTISLTPLATAAPTSTATFKPTRVPTKTPTRTLLPPVPTKRPTSTSTPGLPPSDKDGPPAPAIVGPKSGVILACSTSVVLDWKAPSDPSGIANYRARLQVNSGTGWADVRVWDPVTASQVGANSETTCGGFYRWRVLARDGAGNEGAVSSWAEFSLSMD